MTAGAAAILVVGVGAAPEPVAADHCWAVVVEPSRGPVGTVFVIRGDSDDLGIVTLFHDGSRVGRYRLADRDDEVRFRATSDDVGRWRAHLRIRNGDQPCGPDDWFTVTAAPDTATAGGSGSSDEEHAPPRTPTAPSGWLVGLAGFATAFLATWFGRWRRRLPRTTCPGWR